MKRKHRAGVIGRLGGGRFGHGLHLPSRHLENVEMIAVADENPAGREKAFAIGERSHPLARFMEEGVA